MTTNHNITELNAPLASAVKANCRLKSSGEQIESIAFYLAGTVEIETIASLIRIAALIDHDTKTLDKYFQMNAA